MLLLTSVVFREMAESFRGCPKTFWGCPKSAWCTPLPPPEGLGARCLPWACWLRVPAVQQAGKLRPCGCWNRAKPHSETTKYPAGNRVGGPETTEPVLTLPLHATSCSSWEISSRGGSVAQRGACSVQCWREIEVFRPVFLSLPGWLLSPGATAKPRGGRARWRGSREMQNSPKNENRNRLVAARTRGKHPEIRNAVESSVPEMGTGSFGSNRAG